MIIYFISLISLCFCVITYLWVRHKWERKKNKEILEAIMIDESTTRYRGSIYGDYPTGDTIPVISVVVNARPFQIPIEKKEDFLPKKRMKVHKLDQGIRNQTLVGPGVYTREVDHSIIVRMNRDE